MATEQLAALGSRLEIVTRKLEAKAGGSVAASGDAGEVSEQASEYDVFLKTSFGAVEGITAKTGLENVIKAVNLLKELANEQRKFINFATGHLQPSPEDLAQILAPMADIGRKISDLRAWVLNPKNKCSRYEGFFLEAIYESSAAFNWVQIPLPVPYVQAMIEAVYFHTNKILKEKADNGKEWVAEFKNLLNNLKAYVKAQYVTGFTWGTGDKSRATVEAYNSGASSAVAPPPAPPAGGPPPPPPGPPPPTATPTATSAPAVDSRGALLASLNKGSAVTSGLKKVTDDMKTHKNPNLRMGSAVPYKKPAGTSSVKPAVSKKPVAKKPPKLELEGKTWNVEYQEGATNLVIDNTLMKHTVYIYKCENSTVHVKTKVNSITVDSCKKVAVVFESVVSGVEFINCQSVQAQVLKQLPTATIEKTDGCIIYLSNESLDCQIITAKSSEMNVSIPNESGQFDEFPIVEQFKTTWNPEKKKLVTECHDNVA